MNIHSMISHSFNLFDWMHSAIVEAQQRVADIVQQQVVVRTLIEVLSAAQDLDTNEIGQQCSNIRRQLQPLDVQLEVRLVALTLLSA